MTHEELLELPLDKWSALVAVSHTAKPRVRELARAYLFRSAKLQEVQAERDMGHERLNETRAKRVKGSLYERISWLIELLSAEVAEQRNMREATNAHRVSLEAQLKEAEGLRLAAEYRARQLELSSPASRGEVINPKRPDAPEAMVYYGGQSERGEVVKACPSCGKHEDGQLVFTADSGAFYADCCCNGPVEPALWQLLTPSRP